MANDVLTIQFGGMKVYPQQPPPPGSVQLPAPPAVSGFPADQPDTANQESD